MKAWPMDGPILLHARAYLITRKKIAWEGDRHQTASNRRTARLLDWIGPVGRFDENYFLFLQYALWPKVSSPLGSGFRPKEQTNTQTHPHTDILTIDWIALGAAEKISWTNLKGAVVECWLQEMYSDITVYWLLSQFISLHRERCWHKA